MNGSIGLDFATQSARAVLIDEGGKIRARFTTELAEVVMGKNNSKTQDPKSWLYAIDYLLERIFESAKENSLNPTALVITATSGTFLLCDDEGRPLTHAVMYNDGTANTPLERAEKLGFPGANFKHVPEFLISYLTRERDIPTDWSHALKTGVDLSTKDWRVNTNFKLPKVVAPGTFLGKISDALPYSGISIYAGMTDGCTGQISAGGTKIGSAVTTLGTTLVMKIVATSDISGPGFYSHLIPNSTWLAGGASNLGGVALKKFTDLDKLNELAREFGPANRIVYPLVGVGERFPIASPEMVEVESAKSTSETEEFRSILEGIAFAERLSYEILTSAGAPKIASLNSVGGGTKSKLWSEIRATVLGKEVITRPNAGSDLGAAMIGLAADKAGSFEENLSAIPLQDGITIEPNLVEKEKLEKSYLQFLEINRHSRKDQ
jgi:D-ribulokinase